MEITMDTITYLSGVVPGNIGIYCVERQQIVELFHSPLLAEQTGRTEEEFFLLMRENPLHIIFPADREILQDALAQMIANHDMLDTYFRVTHRNARYDWVHAVVRQCGTIEGKPVVLASFYNASVEADVFQEIINNSRSRIYVIDRKSREILYANEPAMEAARQRGTKLLGDTCYENLRGKKEACRSCQMMRQDADTLLGEDVHFEKENGWVHITGQTVNWCGHDAYIQYVADITEQKKQQETMRSRYRRSMREMLALSPQTLASARINLTADICDSARSVFAQKKQFHWPETAEELFTLTSRYVVGEQAVEEYRSRFNRKALLESFRQGQHFIFFDYFGVGQKGRQSWIRTYVNLLQNPETHDVEGVMCVQDITREQLDREINNIAMRRAYSFIALINAGDGTVEFTFVNSRQAAAFYRKYAIEEGKILEFDKLEQMFAGNSVPIGKKSEPDAGSLDRILSQLQYSDCYEYVSELLEPEEPDGKAGAEQYLKLQHYLLNQETQMVLLLASDMTEEYRSQQELLRLTEAKRAKAVDIIESLTAGICILIMTDQEHLSIDYVNQEFFRMLDYDPAGLPQTMEQAKGTRIENVYRDAFDIVAPEDRPRVQEMFRQHFSSQWFEVEPYRMRGAKGSYHWVSQKVRLREVTESGRIFYATYQIVDEEVRLRRVLEMQLAEEKTLRQKAIESNQAKTDFLSRMSHDIRTPINGIMGMTNIASEQQNPERTMECLKKIDISSHFLLGLINDVLDMARIESNKIVLHPEPYPYQAVEAYFDAVIRPLMEAKKQTFEKNMDVEKDKIPVLDKLRMNQILFNLFSNAVKYTQEGGTISYHLRTRLLPSGKLGVFSVVSDNGIGISEEFQKVLFEPFTQENRNDVSPTRGSGLGLAIVKQMLDLMGCSVSVQSAIGKGTTFRIYGEFDCVDAAGFGKERGQENKEKTDYTCLKGKCVLVFEDHPINQEIVKTFLEHRGMIVELAENGQKGVELFRGNMSRYDAILMDIRMPVLNGYEATGQIRNMRQPKAQRIPIIAMTADAFQEDVDKCLAAGMNEHIAKPLEPQVLYDKLLKFLK